MDLPTPRSSQRNLTGDSCRDCWVTSERSAIDGQGLESPSAVPGHPANNLNPSPCSLKLDCLQGCHPTPMSTKTEQVSSRVISPWWAI